METARGDGLNERKSERCGEDRGMVAKRTESRNGVSGMTGRKMRGNGP